jgi:DNA gyrase subunit B
VSVLRDFAHIRQRPGMYIGDTGPKGLHHLVYELVGNSVDEALAGFCRRIAVRIQLDGSLSVADDGRGIPVEEHPEEKVSTLEVVMTKVGAGAKFGKGTYKFSGGLHGMGAKAVTALSEWVEAQVQRNGRTYRQEYERGKPITPVMDIGASIHTGTRITFKPDPDIFHELTFDYDTLEDRLRELAFLNKGLTIAIHDERTGKEEVFKYDGGLVEFVKYVNRLEDERNPFPILSLEKTVDNVAVEVALQYTKSDEERVRCYTNNAFNSIGGTHLSGFRTALTRTLNAYGTKEELFKNASPIGEDFRDGLTVIISVLVPEPQFDSQEKKRLNNLEVEGIVAGVVSEFLGKYMEEHPKEAKLIMNKVVLAAEAREAAAKAKKALKDRKSILNGGGLPGKLYDCTTRKREDSELFLVEGDSAGGSAESGRNREFQAILPLRGKPLNVEKARIENLLKNEEICSLISAIGVDIGTVQETEEVKDKLRYGKVIIMSVDAEEHVFVRDANGVRMTRIGSFIDALLAARTSGKDGIGIDRLQGEDLGEVLCFGLEDHTVRFRPIRAVIRHPLEEGLFEVRTSYGRSVRVTASHSVFVHEQGQVVLKRGDELKVGDQLVAPRTTRFPEGDVRRIDLLRALHAVPEAARQVWVRGRPVEEWYKARVSAEFADKPDYLEPRVVIPEEVRAEVAQLRQAHGPGNRELCAAAGIRQPVSFYAWEKGTARPTESRFRSYLVAIGADVEDVMSRVTVGPNRLERSWQEQYRGAPRNRVRPYVCLADLDAADLDWFDGREDLQLTPEHYAGNGVPRFLEVNAQLMTLLGFYLAEGSCSSRNGVRLTIGDSNVRFQKEMADALTSAFGLAPRAYEAEQRAGEVKLVNRVAALAWQHVFGFEDASSVTKRIPDLVFNVSEPLRLAFLRGYFLGDGTASGGRIVFATSSRDLASGLIYLLSSFGVVASLAEKEPDRVVREIRGQPCETKHRSWAVTVTAREDLLRLRPVWQDHAGAASVEQKFASTFPSVNRRFESLDGDLMALRVEAITQVEPSNGHVYDFSVAGDENFVAGMGGICCHNTDADVDGQHIRTLLLTFFYRQMPRLVEEGRIYVARPPLYKVTEKKHVRFVQTAKEMHDELMGRGLKGTRLMIYPPASTTAEEAAPPGAPRSVEGDDLAALVKLMARMEDALVTLERRGVNLTSFVARAGERGLPIYRVLLAGREEWCFTREEVDALRRREQDRLGHELVVDDEAPAGTHTHTNGHAEVFYDHELHEVREINRGLAELSNYGLGASDLVPPLRIAGREPPVRLKLETGEHHRVLAHLRELVTEVRRLGERGLSITRFKGLGEMDADELWDTTLDPEKRRLMRVKLEDALKADEMFRTLMGEKVEPRRDFIVKYALEVKDLDYHGA